MPMTRDTLQRRLITDAVHSLRCHPTAEEVYRHVAATHPSVSKATIYRNLGQMAEEGSIRRVSHLDAADRYDFNLEPHYHFICERCGKVFDAGLPPIEDWADRVHNPKGFVYKSCDITFSGFCPECK